MIGTRRRPIAGRRAALLALALAACSGPAPEPANTVIQTSAGAVDAAPRDFAGRWTGVEGMFLQVTALAEAGRYRLEMQSDLDRKGFYEGTADGNGIAFDRDGKRMALRPTDGDATGLKYLAGKKDCLTVAPGEGYCRD